MLSTFHGAPNAGVRSLSTQQTLQSVMSPMRYIVYVRLMSSVQKVAVGWFT